MSIFSTALAATALGLNTAAPLQAETRVPRHTGATAPVGPRNSTHAPRGWSAGQTSVVRARDRRWVAAVGMSSPCWSFLQMNRLSAHIDKHGTIGCVPVVGSAGRGVVVGVPARHARATGSHAIAFGCLTSGEQTIPAFIDEHLNRATRAAPRDLAIYYGSILTTVPEHLMIQTKTARITYAP